MRVQALLVQVTKPAHSELVHDATELEACLESMRNEDGRRRDGGMFGFKGKTKQSKSSSSSLYSIVARSLRRTTMSGDSLTRSDLIDV